MSEPRVTVPELPDDAVFLDVREDNEFVAGHIEGAHHIPLGQLADRYGEVPTDVDLYVVCRTGGRALRATAWLNLNGFDAIVVDGGMGAWNLDHGRPIVSDNGEEPRVI